MCNLCAHCIYLCKQRHGPCFRIGSNLAQLLFPCRPRCIYYTYMLREGLHISMVFAQNKVTSKWKKVFLVFSMRLLLEIKTAAQHHTGNNIRNIAYLLSLYICIYMMHIYVALFVRGRWNACAKSAWCRVARAIDAPIAHTLFVCTYVGRRE